MNPLEPDHFADEILALLVRSVVRAAAHYGS
jgi:hypothetical protein